MMFNDESTKLEISIRFENDNSELEDDDVEGDDTEEDAVEDNDYNFDWLSDRYPNEEDEEERVEFLIKDMEKARDRYW